MTDCQATCPDHGVRCFVGGYHGMHHARDGCYWRNSEARVISPILAHTERKLLNGDL